MIRLRLAIQLHYQVQPPGGDFVFHLHAAFTPRQRVVSESLHFSQPLAYTLESSPPSTNRVLRTSALPGMLQVAYAATVDLDHWVAAPATIAEVPVNRLPTNVLPYLYPCRYCQSDLLLQFAQQEFGQRWQGYSRVQAIRDWVLQHTAFSPNTSNSNTSALDTLQSHVGVCRAANVPARFTTGIDYGADPALGPTDFHASMWKPMWATAGICLTPPAPPSPWAWCALPPGAMRPTWPLPPSSAPCKAARR